MASAYPSGGAKETSRGRRQAGDMRNHPETPRINRSDTPVPGDHRLLVVNTKGRRREESLVSAKRPKTGKGGGGTGRERGTITAVPRTPGQR